MLDIKSGEKVLDIGAGIGGNAFQMAQLYGSVCYPIFFNSEEIPVKLRSKIRSHVPGEG